MAARLFTASEKCPGPWIHGRTIHRFSHLTLATMLLTVIPISAMSTENPVSQAVGPTATDSTLADLQTEIVTEIVTEYVEDEARSSTSAQVTGGISDDVTTKETDPRGTTLIMTFTISNRNYSELRDSTEKAALTTTLGSEFNKLLRSDKLKSATVLQFRNGSVIVDMELEFTDVLNVKERDDVLIKLFETIVLNGTLGALQLQELKMLTDNGQVQDVNDACDIRPCLRDDMKCVAEGTKCTATCNDNEDYCLNGSICRKNNDYIVCKCKEDFFGYRCDKKPKPPVSVRDENAYIGIIAAAATAVILLMVILVGCGYNRFFNKGNEYDTSKLFPAENPVALEMLDEPPTVGGVGCQTVESFLLAKYMKHEVPPKPGFQHELVQTNDSFLRTKAQREIEATTKKVPMSLPSVSDPMSRNEQPDEDGHSDHSNTEPEKDDLPQEVKSAQGVSNKAFIEDEGDIVPTSELVKGDSELGKNIIKV